MSINQSHSTLSPMGFGIERIIVRSRVMTVDPSHSMLGRRNFLKLLAAGGAVAAGGYALFEFSPWLDYAGQAEDLWSMPKTTTNPPEQLHALVHAATLAANGHNAQPWKFAIEEKAIRILPDYSRALPVVDPDHRELWISLGCALENLLIAARAGGFAAEVVYPDAADLIHIRLESDAPENGALFDAIPARQNTRSQYDGRAVPGADLDRLMALPPEPGVSLRFVTEPAGLETLVDYVNQGNLRQYADRAFVDELIYWLRFNKKEALASLDGLYTRCTGNPETPRWLGKMFVSGTKPQQQADADAAKLRSSSGAVVIASEADSKTAWVRAGQVYQRLALTMAALDIKSAFLNQPIEIAEVRSQFGQAFGPSAALPQLLVRYGYAPALPRSLRRPVEAVLAV